LARALIVGCGCRGRELAAALRSRGWRVRGTSRTLDGVGLTESAGIEAAQADPDRPGTILELCGDVAVVVWLLGSAEGEPAELCAIHGPRLERLLEKLVDTPVRGFAYEGTGTVAGATLEGGRRVVEVAGERWHIPVGVLSAERAEAGWAATTADAIERLLAA
jgi:nucleoside-diphosphate-sugar epimerase